jgi:hypothetical protein
MLWTIENASIEFRNAKELDQTKNNKITKNTSNLCCFISKTKHCI